ncbi:MAG: hypothetical protein C0511_09220 [Hyphomicrobium sp.]|nr:hypothetical protein [Hyphomicrobium sp.]
MTHPFNVTVHWGATPTSKPVAAFWLFSDAHRFAEVASKDYPDGPFAVCGPVAKGTSLSVYLAGVKTSETIIGPNGEPCEDCDGNGKVWNNGDPTSGQWVPCEVCR